MAAILVIEDDRSIRAGLLDTLRAKGYSVQTAERGAEGLALFRRELPDLVILDLMLPDMEGFEVCRQLKAPGAPDVPVIILTARGAELDRVRGLELGADDYVTKPFGLKELLARIRAVLRRAGDLGRKDLPDSIQIDKVSVDLVSGRVRRGRREAVLGYYECEILKMLLRNAGEVVPRRDILKEIWELENEPFNRSVDNHIVSLRRKVEEDPSRPRHVLTVHGIGYKLVL